MRGVLSLLCWCGSSLCVGRVGEDGYAGKGVEKREPGLFGDVKALGDVEAGEVTSTREGGERCIGEVDQAKQVERFQHRRGGGGGGGSFIIPSL